MVIRLGLSAGSQVVEVASNDGYLLQFRGERHPVLGIEPAANVANRHRQGIPTEVAFFGSETAQRLHDRGVAADLIVAITCWRMSPLTDFVDGLRILHADGTITIECPTLRLVAQNQFDTISRALLHISRCLCWRRFASSVFGSSTWRVSNAWRSLRVYVRHAASAEPPSPAVLDVLARERERASINWNYERFGAQVVNEMRRPVVFRRCHMLERRLSATARRQRATRC